MSSVDTVATSAHDAGPGLCVVCFENPSGAQLQPCGHDYFCQRCAVQFRSCPLCREPLLLHGGRALLDQSSVEMHQTPPNPKNTEVISRPEGRCLLFVGLAVWFFLFVVGWVENEYNTNDGCALGDPWALGNTSWALGNTSTITNLPDTHHHEGGSEDLQESEDSEDNEEEDLREKYPFCKSCSHGGKYCQECEDGFLQTGQQCFKHLDNIPPVKVGAALGGSTYFGLIVATQVLGATSEILLIRRLRKRELMPAKEFFILITALAIELTRMFMVDAFVLQKYFNGDAYSIFRVPVPCEPTERAWRGADMQWYCDNAESRGPESQYYIATEQSAYTADAEECSVFTPKSALLDYDETSGHWYGSGHARFTRLGWVIGGEFAVYYWFATVVNEVADNMFVVPTTTGSGWLCKIFSVALELFQLGALCPAAIFTHNKCLHYTDPLGVSLHLIRGLIVAFGYCIWGFMLLMLPLAFAGLAITGLLWCSGGAALRVALWPAQFVQAQKGRSMERLARTAYFLYVVALGAAVGAAVGAAAGAANAAAASDGKNFEADRAAGGAFGARIGALVSGAVFALSAPLFCSIRTMQSAAEHLSSSGAVLARVLEKQLDGIKSAGGCLTKEAMRFAFVPLLISGMFLGTLVVVGQGSKKGAVQVFTAVVLLSDVLFKIVATIVTEVIEYSLHRRVKRAVAAMHRSPDANSVTVSGQVIGQETQVYCDDHVYLERTTLEDHDEISYTKAAIKASKP